MNSYRIKALVTQKEPNATERCEAFTVQARSTKEARERFPITFDDKWKIGRILFVVPI